jgi:phosphoserine phosphatase RsbU/P
MEILIIDDSVEICESLVIIIENTDLEVKFFLSSTEAIAYFQESLNPIIFLDIHLPDQNGIEILSYIKKVSPFTQVIMMTGENDISHAISSLKNQAFDFLIKPFSAESVRSSLLRAISFHKIQIDNHNYQEQLNYNLKFISKVQKNILFPKLELNNLFANFNSIESDFGSFYYLYETDEESILFFGDVEGEDVTSGLVGLVSISIFKELLLKERSVSKILSKLNNELYYKINLHSISCFSYNYNKTEKTMRYSCIGFPPPIILDDQSNQIIELEKNDDSILGVIPDASIIEKTISIDAGKYLYVSNSIFSESLEAFALNEKNEFINLKKQILSMFVSDPYKNQNTSFFLKKF